MDKYYNNFDYWIKCNKVLGKLNCRFIFDEFDRLYFIGNEMRRTELANVELKIVE